MNNVKAVKEQICDNYCKWPEQWNGDRDGRSIEECICIDCPLNLLSDDNEDGSEKREDSAVRKEWKESLECMDEYEISEKICYSLSRDDLLKLTGIHEVETNLQDKIVSLLENCNFHRMAYVLSKRDYDMAKMYIENANY